MHKETKGPCIVSMTCLIGLVTFLVGCHKVTWEEQTRSNSIRMFTNVSSSNDLYKIVGDAGVVLTLTNGSWVAIRVVGEFCGEPITYREVTIARDSDGKYYESRDKFTGSLSYYKHYKLPIPPGGVKETVPECLLLDDIESSVDLNEARSRMRKLGFYSIDINRQ